MASNPIKKKDIAVKNVAGNLISGLKKSKALVDALTKSLKELGEVHKENISILKKAPDTIKKTKDLNKAIQKSEVIVGSLNKTKQDSIDIDKKILAAEKKLKSANSDRIQQLTELQVQLQEQNRANKNLIKENAKIVGAYTAQSTRLNRLRKEYKNLAVQNKENTKEARNLLAEITRLDKKLKDVDDTVGQNQRSVGNYAKAVEGLGAALRKIGIVTAILKAFELLGDAFSNTREGAVEMQIALSVFTETAKVFINNTIKAWEGIKEFFVALHESFLTFDALVARTAKKIQLSFLEILNKNPLSDFSDEINNVKEEIRELNKEMKNLEKSSFSDAIDKITKAYEGTAETTSRAIDEQEKYLRLQLRTRIEIEQQEKALAGLAEKRQLLQDISDDDTIGFVARAKAVQKAQDAAIEFADTENRLAVTKEKLTIEAVKQDLRRANALSENELSQIRTGEELQRILLDENKAKKVSDANDEAFTAAFVERRDKQVEAESFRRDQEEKFRKTARDAFEQELDILEEFTEKRIASNEKIINSDSASLEERQSALRENQKLEEELFESSIELLLEQGRTSIDTLKKTIDLRKDLTDSEKKEEKALLDKRKALLSSAAIQEILNEQDIEKQIVLIRNLDLGEIEEKRLKETLKIKKETAETNKENLKIEEDAAQRTKELQLDVATQRAFLSGEAIDLEKAQTQNQIDQLEERIHNAKAGSIEMLELQKELNALLIDEEVKRLEKEEQLRVDQLNKIQTFANLVADEFTKIIKSRNAESIKLADEEIARAEKSVERQREIAAKGQENILGEEQARLDKANLAKKREAERAAKQEQAIALATAFINNLSARQKNAKNKEESNAAFALALRDTFAAKLIAEGLASFYDGTEDTGTTAKPLDSKGGRKVIVHDNERIMTKAQNDKMGGVSNDYAADIIQNHLNGNLDLSPSHFKQLEVGRMMQPKQQSMQPIIDQMQKDTAELKAAYIKGQTNITTHWNELGDATEIRYKNGVRKSTTFKRPRLG
jgi:hypothetical protein